MKKIYLSLAAFCFVLSASAQFSGAYTPANWNTVLLAGSNGSVNTAGAPASIIITGSDDPSGTPSPGPVNTDFTITAVSSGTWGFSWSYHTNDADADARYDLAGILVNGVFTQLTDNNGGVDQSGTFTAPNVTAGAVIGFRISATDNVFGDATFTISAFAPPGTTLPLTLTSFTAKNQGENVKLQWFTQDESGIAGFNVERSADGNKFTSIKSVTPHNTQGQKTYDAVDEFSLPGISYYRLRITEKYGSEKFSAVAVVNRSSLLNLQVHPNPVKSAVQITIVATKPAKEIIKLLDASGRILSSSRYELTKGHNTFSINTPSLTPGVYYIMAQGKVVSFVKE